MAMNYYEELEDLKNRHDKFKGEYFSRKGRKEQLESQKDSISREIKRLEESIETTEKVRILIQRVSEYAREQSRRQIETLVTGCLQYIFESELEFRIDIHEVRGRPEAEFFVISKINGEEIKTRPQEARGGGIVDIISLALRFAMLQCSNIETEGPIILDEPAKHVSEEYIARVGEFLRQMAKMFDRQIIMVTHNRYLGEIADVKYKVEMREGVSKTTVTTDVH
jgi:DNA repair exonuclease SbcCD ATPase subunit